MAEMKPGITVVIPTIPPREKLLNRALYSVQAAFREFAHSGNTSPMSLRATVGKDVSRSGAARTRQNALADVDTQWTAFLDDDDEFQPDHLVKLYKHALYMGADYVYSWYTVVGGTDPFPENFGKLWDPDNPVQTTITVLVRTELAQSVGFDTVPDGAVGTDGHRRGEDFRFTMGCQAAGGVISHLPERTWIWHHHSSNTSGMPDRW